VIRSLVVKMKFADFQRTTAERAGFTVDPAVFEQLLAEVWKRGDHRAVRLLGVGVRFEDPQEIQQLEFFE
jgi:DNA polymerase IV